MVESLEVVVGVTNLKLQKFFLFVFLVMVSNSFSQSNSTYKKRVLETTEIGILTSYYTQDGEKAVVTGGVGTEELTNTATNVSVSIPLNDDDVLSIDATISAYSSASSSNLNPFDSSHPASPWVESSGASAKDVWVNANLSYSHSSDDRNNIWSGNLSFASEFDYTSIGFGGSYTRLLNQQNTELGIKANIYFDSWSPKYPEEIHQYFKTNGDLNEGMFKGVDILDEQGLVIDKDGSDIWSVDQSELIEDESRNTYSVSLSFSQILTENTQISLFSDLISQEGWLGNPMQRVYFADKDNYYIGQAESISDYTSSKNKGVFHLADDIERLPDNRLKIPIGIRFNYYINEYLVLRNYYRYYQDDWDLKAHTINIELPIKISDSFTLYPSYRYYTQTEAKYYAGYDQLLSTSEYYTSDTDLSEFDSYQLGFGLQYKDLFSETKFWSLGFKSFNLNYSYYKRDSEFKAHIISFGAQFIL